MFSRSQTCRYLALFLCVAFAGCAPLNKYSFETFSPIPRHSRDSSGEVVGRSDLLALVYADYVAKLLEGRSTGARITREASDSSLAIAGILTTAHETLKISAETLAQMGVGIAIVRELQGIFNARGRSEAFADAAYLIRQAQADYRAFDPNPSSTEMTENGATLVRRVDSAVYAAQKTLIGRMPTLVDLQQAHQAMTKSGASRTGAGTPESLVTAAGERQVTKADLDAAVDARVKEWTKRQSRKGGQDRSQPVTLSAFQAEVLALRAKLPDIQGASLEALWKKRYSTPYMGEDVARSTLFADLTTLSGTNAQSDGTMSATTLSVLAQWKLDLGP